MRIKGKKQEEEIKKILADIIDNINTDRRSMGQPFFYSRFDNQDNVYKIESHPNFNNHKKNG